VRFAVSGLFLAATFATACAPQALDCGEPAVLESHPQRQDFKGAPLGPLLVRNFPDDATTAVVTVYEPGHATKVVIAVAKPFATPLTMRGRRCSDGTPLRFAASYPFALNSTPAPSDVFAAAGFEAPVIDPVESLPVGVVMGAKAPPYMLFTSSGKWLLEVFDGTRLVGRTVLHVQ
jgi:hypothetical protein